MRSVVLQVHRWLGIALAIWVIAIGLSGAVLIFRPELQKLTYPQFFHVTRAAGSDASAGGLLASLRVAYPRGTISGIDWPTYRRDTVLSYVLEGTTFRTVFLHPQTAAIIGEMPEHSWITRLQDFHFDLLGGPTGRTVNGVAALCLVGMLATGIVIWWPAVGRWRQSLTIDFSRPWKRINWQAHNAVGFWLFAMFLVWAVTGVEFAFPRQFRSAVNAMSPLTTRPAPRSDATDQRGQPVPAPDALVAAARAQVPGAILARLVLPTSPSAATLVLMAKRIHGDYDTSDEVYLFFDQYTGRLIERREHGDVKRTAGDVAMATLGPLHLGTFGSGGVVSTTVRALWVVFALGFPLLAVSGTLMWWNK